METRTRMLIDTIIRNDQLNDNLVELTYDYSYGLETVSLKYQIDVDEEREKQGEIKDER